MSIFDYLDSVRAKPLEERKRILAVWTGLLMFVIAGLWVVNMLWVLGPVEEPLAENVATSSGDGLEETADSPAWSSWREHAARVKVGFQAVSSIVKHRVSGEE